MLNRKVIGIVGQKQTGKDTLSNYIVSRYNGVRFTLADTLKEITRILFRWSDDQLYGDRKEEIDSRWGISPRQSFQWFGTEVMQFSLTSTFPIYKNLIGRTHWCHLLLNDMERYSASKSSPFIITDIRFKHELDFFKSLSNFKSIKLIKDTGLEDNHCSEKESINLNTDYTIYNNNSIIDLYSNFDRLGIL